MNREEEYLISLCSSYVNGTAPKAAEEIDFPALFRLARHHNLLAVLHCVLNKSEAAEDMPEEFLSAVKDAFFEYVYTAEQQSKALADLDEAMSGAGVKYVLFKGAVLRELYPVKESRAMGDIDLLISPESVETAGNALKAMGFKCTADNGSVHDWRRDGILLEVHNRIIDDFGENAFANAFENAAFDGCKGQLEPDYHTAYLIAHTAHHFRYYGAGIKLVLDLAVIQKSCGIDLEKVFALLDKIELRKFGEIIFTVCKKWFGVGTAFEHDTQRVEDFIASGGAFGSLLGNKSAVLTRRELEEGKSGSAFSVKLHLAFPPYEKMRKLKYIGFLDGRPWLTPAAWAYRFAYTFKNRRGFTKKAVQSIGNKETVTEAENQLEFFEEIGIR